MYYDQDAEWRLLSSLMSNPDMIHIITPAIFTDERKDIILAMKEAYVRYGECTYEVMRMALSGNVPAQMLVQVNVNQQAVVDELGIIARRRQLFEAAKALDFESRQYFPNESKVEEVLNFPPIVQAHDTTLVPGAQRMLGDLNQKIDGSYKFTHTGIRFLDTMLGGEWLPKTLNIIMAKPGTGKTALIGQSMLEMARQYNTRSLFFSLEMSKEQLISRWVAYLLKMDASHLQFGRVTQEQADKIEQAVVYLQSLPMSVIDDPTVSLATIKKEIRDCVRTGCKVVFLDYLQIVRHSPTANRNNDLGEVAQTLKEAAKENNIAIVLLSQMTKGREGLDAVRDSGEVAQVADAVIEMAPIDDVSDDQGNRAISLKFHKNRNGKLGVSTVIFNGSTQKFSSQQADN